MTRALRDIPAVQALAEREARAFYDALPPLSPQRTPRAVRRMSTTTEPGWETVGSETTTWEEQSEEWRNAIIAAYLALLTDLTRPASRDAVLRLVAGRIWPDRTVTALRFLRCHPDSWYVSAVVGGYESEQVRRLSRYDGHDEAEALALIADAVLP